MIASINVTSIYGTNLYRNSSKQRLSPWKESNRESRSISVCIEIGSYLYFLLQHTTPHRIVSLLRSIASNNCTHPKFPKEKPLPPPTTFAVGKANRGNTMHRCLALPNTSSSCVFSSFTFTPTIQQYSGGLAEGNFHQRKKKSTRSLSLESFVQL